MDISKDLLIHWWHYYGSLPYTLEELEKFEEIINKYGEKKVFDFITHCYIEFDGKPTSLLLCIRKGGNVVDELFSVILDPSSLSPADKADWDKLQQYLFYKISEIYQHH